MLSIINNNDERPSVRDHDMPYMPCKKTSTIRDIYYFNYHFIATKIQMLFNQDVDSGFDGIEMNNNDYWWIRLLRASRWLNELNLLPSTN